MNSPTPAAAAPLSFRAAVREGMVAVAPLLLGIVPFGIVAGVAAVDAGLGLGGAVGLSVGIFAGASQLAAIELLSEDAPLLVILATIAVINARMIMYSAAVAPLVPDVPRSRRMIMAYMLVDQAFAFTVARGARGERRQTFGYFMGVAMTLWTGWQATTIFGAVVGAALPEWLPLGAAIPLMFLVILIPTISDRATVTAAVVSAGVAVLAAGLPANTGLLVAAFSGIVAGSVVAERARAAQQTAEVSA